MDSKTASKAGSLKKKDTKLLDDVQEQNSHKAREERANVEYVCAVRFEAVLLRSEKDKHAVLANVVGIISMD